MKEVREERTEWRDLELSKRHRLWGYDCPAVDIDFLLIEYDGGHPVAIIEYKNEHAPMQHFSSPSYHALAELGNHSLLPVFSTRYTDDFSKWRATAVNETALRKLEDLGIGGYKTEIIPETEYVKILYRLRKREMPKSVLDAINAVYAK